MARFDWCESRKGSLRGRKPRNPFEWSRWEPPLSRDERGRATHTNKKGLRSGRPQGVIEMLNEAILNQSQPPAPVRSCDCGEPMEVHSERCQSCQREYDALAAHYRPMVQARVQQWMHDEGLKVATPRWRGGIE